MNTKLVISRSFSKKKQIGAYEPIDAYCSIQAEYEQSFSEVTGGGELLTDEFVRSISQHLDILVRQEVERTIEAEMKKVEEVKTKHIF